MEGCAETEIGTERGKEWEEIKSAVSFTLNPIKSDAQPLSVSISVSLLVFVEVFHLSTAILPQDSRRRILQSEGAKQDFVVSGQRL